MTRIFFATDLHGSESCFLKFMNSAKLYSADVLILGGDLTGKMIIPIVRQGDTHYCDFLEQHTILSSEAEVEKFEKTINSSGFYPYRATQDEVKELSSDQKKLDILFSRLTEERIGKWMRIAEERLKPLGCKLYVTGGNDDKHEIDDIIRKSTFVIEAEGKVFDLDEQHEMLSSGWTNPTPWKLPREESEEQLERRFETMAGTVKSMENCVFNLHAPPIDSELDTCPQLDGSVYPPKPVTSGGGIVMYGAGSKAVRRLIERYQPLLGLHGHIHEARGRVKIGKTLCINPGSEYSEGILRGVLVTFEKKGKMVYQFTSA